MKAPSVTQIGMAPTRAPAPDREELLKLARGVRARYRRTTTPQQPERDAP